MFHFEKIQLPNAEQALKGRAEYDFVLPPHRLFGCDLGQFDQYPKRLLLGMGCFWGAERLFWQQQGVVYTAVGYAGGHTPFATYEEVCSGLTGHTEVVAVAYDEQQSLEQLLALFWQRHDPTQGMRQGNDTGTQYRSALYLYSEQDLALAIASRDAYQKQLDSAGFGAITTEIALADKLYFAEPYHQQYLDKNPNGYCGLKGTGVSCA